MSIRLGGTDAGWSVWTLVGFSSLGYTYFLSRKSEEFRVAVFKKVRKNEIVETNLTKSK